MATDPLEAVFLWPDPEKGPWFVEVWSRVQHGVPTPVGLRILGWNPDEPMPADPSPAHTERERALRDLPRATDPVAFPRLTSSVIRSLPMGQFFDEAHAALAQALSELQIPDELTQTWSDEGRERAATFNDSLRAESEGFAGRRSGRDLGDDHYREVAQIYADAVREGRPPTKAVSEHFVVSKSAAAKKVARARDRGFLPPEPGRGRIGATKDEL